MVKRLAKPRQTRIHIFAAVALTAMTSCSTVPTAENGTAAQTISSFAPTAPKPGFGAVYVGRPMTFHTSIFALPIELDGKPFVSLAPDQYARVELPPGRHEIKASDTHWSRAINGVPHPADVTVEAGKSYYLLPSRWAGESRTTITMVGNMAIPERTAVGHSSFSVNASAPGAAPPNEFLKLNYVEQ